MRCPQREVKKTLGDRGFFYATFLGCNLGPRLLQSRLD